MHRYKWDVVRSLLKSVTGLQARKLQELQVPNYGSEPPDSLELRSSAGFKAGLMSLLKGGRKGLGGRVRLGSGGEGGADELEALAGEMAAAAAAAAASGGAGDGGEGGELGTSEGGEGGGSGGGGGADYLELMRSAMRVKHKQRKVLLLLGAVPPLPLAPPTPPGGCSSSGPAARRQPHDPREDAQQHP
jgi:hypothetical protein